MQPEADEGVIVIFPTITIMLKVGACISTTNRTGAVMELTLRTSFIASTDI